jgi:hyperosmotically inducible protein
MSITLRMLALPVLIGLFSAASPVVLAQERTPLPDRQIQNLIEHRLLEKKISAVTVSVADGVVTLAGAVPSLWAKNEAVEQARTADDVRSIVSDLTIVRAESDTTIGEQVAERIRRYEFFTIFDDANLAVNQGVVILTGRVTMPYKADEIGLLASRVTGVQEVRNEITALPLSDFDDQLRHAIAREMYRDPLFWKYANQANPPIHIIVENGRVTLSGGVRSEVELRRAGSIARNTGGAFSVDNQLRTEGQR